MTGIGKRTVLAAATYCAGAPALAAEPIKVGLVTALSGQSALAGEAITRGLTIAIDEINAKGGLLDGRKIELVRRDDEGNPTKGVTAARELIYKEKVAVLFGGLDTPVSVAIVRMTNQEKVPFMGPWAAGTPITKNGASPNFAFRVSAVDEIVDKGMLSYALKTFKASKPGMILVNNAWGESNEKGLSAALAAKGMQAAGVEKFEASDVDVVPQLTRLKMAGADVRFMVGNVGPSAQVVKSLDRMGWKVPVVSHWGPAGGRFTELAGPSAKSVHFVQTYSFFGKQSAVGVANAYDALQLAALAIAKAGSTDGDAVRQGFYKIDRYEGLIKTYVKPFTPAVVVALAICAAYGLLVERVAVRPFVRRGSDGLADGDGGDRHRARQRRHVYFRQGAAQPTLVASADTDRDRRARARRLSSATGDSARRPDARRRAAFSLAPHALGLRHARRGAEPRRRAPDGNSGAAHRRRRLRPVGAVHQRRAHRAAGERACRHGYAVRPEGLRRRHSGRHRQRLGRDRRRSAVRAGRGADRGDPRFGLHPDHQFLARHRNAGALPERAVRARPGAQGMSAAPAPAAPEASPVLFAQSGLLRPWQLAVALLALAGSLLLAATLNNYYVFVLASVALLALVGIGLNVLIRLSGQVSFGHVGFYALGAYAVAILTTRAGLGFWAAWSLAAAGCALVGALLAIPALRVKGPYLAMVTIAFGFIVEHATVEMSGLTGGQNGIMGIAGPSFGTLLSGERAVAALALVAYALLARGNWGTALLAGLAGGLYAPLSGFVTPGSFGFIQPILFVLVVMIGGAGTLLGPLLGALIVGILPELLARFENVRLLIFGALLLVVLWSAPNGVVGLLMQCWSAVRRRFAGGVLAPEFAVPVPDLERRLRRTLRAEALSMQFGGVRAVSELSFSVAPAVITSLIGPNGAGKSTVINMLSGFYVPSAGRIFLDDVALHGKSAHAIERAGIARTYQTSQLFGSLSVLDNVALALPRGELGALLSDYQIRSHKARWRAARLLRWCGYAGRLQQAAGLSRADKERLAVLLRRIADAGIGVVLVEHDMALVMDISDQVVVIDAGVYLASGSCAEVQNDAAVQKAYLGENATAPNRYCTRLTSSCAAATRSRCSAPTVPARRR